MAANLIEQAFEVYERHQRQRGVPTDEVSFVGGFMSCFGVLTGRVPVELPPGATVLQRFELIQRELDDYRQRVVAGQDLERRNGG
jgi:hypothetical protein